jgi:hypothetical protein
VWHIEAAQCWLEALGDPPPAALIAGAPLNRWTLEPIRTHFAGLADYSLRGIWRLLHRHDLKLRSARVQQYSPDPDYASKVADLEMCLWEARRYPGEVEAVFPDEFSYRRWPDPAPDWAAATPVANRQQSPDPRRAQQAGGFPRPQPLHPTVSRRWRCALLQEGSMSELTGKSGKTASTSPG